MKLPCPAKGFTAQDRPERPCLAGRPPARRRGRLLLAGLVVLGLSLAPIGAQSPATPAPTPSAEAGKVDPGTAETMIRRTLDILKELYKVLADIKGRATAMEAVPKIKAIAGRMQDLKADAEKLGPLDETLSAQLQKKFEKEVQDLTEKLAAVLKKLGQNPAAWEEIAPAMQELPPSLLQGQN